jgi:heat shock protein HtpX
MGKRIFLFLAVNFLVIMTLSILMRVLGIEPYITPYGLNYESLAIFCLIWGMGGAFISLLISKPMAKFSMGVKIIDQNQMGDAEQWLVNTVKQLSSGAGLSKMPEVGIYQSPEPNAFATGATKNSSLVAVSTGLLQSMNKEEVEGVLGHEIAHIANGDMVTMTLLQGVVNAFVMFLARIIAFALMRGGSDEEEGAAGSPFMYYMVVFGLEMVLMIFGSMVVAWFSRWREFRADAGGGKLAGRHKMANALRALQRNYNIEAPQESPAFQSMKISGHPKGFLRFFASHPPLEERIKRLEMGAV